MNVDSLDVWQDPDSTGASLGVIAKGDSVKVVETRGSFSKIEFQDGYGWVMSESLTPAGDALSNPFTDVKEEDYFYEPVLWAFYHDPQITNGMTDTTFGPDLTVTRGQCVTFLWRAMGKPEPTLTENPFTDVPADQYYYTAVLWAVENGITNGVTETTFAPDMTLSTAHITTFLYRALDIGPDGWYQDAADWAAADHLLDGTDLTAAPGVNCPRGAVVTFLYREMARL